MKKLLALSIYAMFFLVHSNVVAQVVTSDEEFNYLSKGYKVQIESGLDMKKGYLFAKSITVSVNPKYSFEFKPLVRELTKEVAAVLLVATDKSSYGNPVYYLCIPRGSDVLMKRHTADLTKMFDYTMIRVYAETTSSMMGEFIGQMYNAK